MISRIFIWFSQFFLNFLINSMGKISMFEWHHCCCCWCIFFINFLNVQCISTMITYCHKKFYTYIYQRTSTLFQSGCSMFWTHTQESSNVIDFMRHLQTQSRVQCIFLGPKPTRGKIYILKLRVLSKNKLFIKRLLCIAHRYIVLFFMKYCK